MAISLDRRLAKGALPRWMHVTHDADAAAEYGRAPTDALFDDEGWRDVGTDPGASPDPGERVIELEDVVVGSDGGVWRDDTQIVGRAWGLPAQERAEPGEPDRRLDGRVTHVMLDEKSFGHWLLHRLPRLRTAATLGGATTAIGTALPWDDGELYTAAGFPPDRVVRLHQQRPEWVHVERLVLASHAARPSGDRRIDRRRLASVIAHLDTQWAPTDSTPLDLYVARRDRPGERPGCRNAAELEEFFAARGCTVVYPTDLAIADQFRIFRRARTLIGEFGSGMIWAMAANPGASVLQVTSRAGTAGLEYDTARKSWSRAIADARGQHYGQVIVSASPLSRHWEADLSVLRDAWASRPTTIAPHLPR